ncbi:MAG: hypothetical protein M1834_000799 [Cirrosporium novae-zelandiae]|nr:MAG: hypothetical protein M1834_000799 [Cirrosporium novae-zelandiae]
MTKSIPYSFFRPIFNDLSDIRSEEFDFLTTQFLVLSSAATTLTNFPSDVINPSTQTLDPTTPTMRQALRSIRSLYQAAGTYSKWAEPTWIFQKQGDQEGYMIMWRWKKENIPEDVFAVIEKRFELLASGNTTALPNLPEAEMIRVL